MLQLHSVSVQAWQLRIMAVAGLRQSAELGKRGWAVPALTPHDVMCMGVQLHKLEAAALGTSGASSAAGSRTHLQHSHRGMLLSQA